MKKCLLLLLSALLIILLTACSSTPTDVAEESESATNIVSESAIVPTDPEPPALSEEETLRQTVVDYMRKMGTVEWTPQKTLDFSKNHSETLVYKAGQAYRGMPYTNYRGGYEIFANELNKKGVYSGPVGYQKTYGNTCATSIKNAWLLISNSIDFEYSIDMMPCHEGSGILAIGDIPWDRYDGKNTTNSIVKRCKPTALYEAYAQLKPGDAIVRYLDTAGHAMMVTGEVKLFYKTDGSLYADRCTVICTDQTGSFTATKEGEPRSTWNIDRERTFSFLYNEGYLPITIKELQEGKTEDPKLYLAGEPTAETLSKTRAFRGAVNSNFKMTSVTSTLTDKNGKVLFEYTAFPEGKVFNLSKLNDLFSLKTMIPGSYTFTVKATIGLGEFEVFTVNFTL